MVGVVLMTRDFGDRFTLRIQNDPPGTELPSQYVMTFSVLNRPPGCLVDAGF